MDPEWGHVPGAPPPDPPMLLANLVQYPYSSLCFFNCCTNDFIFFLARLESAYSLIQGPIGTGNGSGNGSENGSGIASGIGWGIIQGLIQGMVQGNCSGITSGNGSGIDPGNGSGIGSG